MINALDILNEIADRQGWRQIATLEAATLPPDHRKMLRLLNRLLRTVGGYNDWPLLQAEGTIRLVDALEGDADSSEYVTATKNSASVTIDNVTLDETYIGRGFQVSGDEVVYRIEAVTSPTTITLDQAWINASITAADQKTFTIAMDKYALPSDYDRAIGDSLNFYNRRDIKPMTPYEFQRLRYDEPTIIDHLGEPDYYTIKELTDNQSAQIIQFHQWPKTARLLKFPYVKLHPEIDSDQDKILYPVGYMEAFINTMLYIASRDYDDASPAKIQQIMLDGIRAHNLQQGGAGPTESNLQLRPANRVRRQIRRAYGFPVVNVDWGDSWDTGENFGRG